VVKLSELKAALAGMTPAPWDAWVGPPCIHVGDTEIAQMSWHGNVNSDGFGIVTLRNSADVLLRVASAALELKRSNEDVAVAQFDLSKAAATMSGVLQAKERLDECRNRSSAARLEFLAALEEVEP
jgi:hypothetical protein